MRSAGPPWHRSRTRVPEPSPSPQSDDDIRNIAELLDNVQQLRLTLAADLATAAGAIEADEPAIARDIIAADSVEVRRLGRPATADPQPAPRRRRALLALPAIPLMGALAMTSAAAFSGGSAPTMPTAGHAASAPAARQTPQQISQTATSTLQQLERAMSRDRQPGRVVALAAHFHDQLTALIATSANNPARLGEVQHLLAVEQQLLERQSGEAAAIALAASRKVTHLLKMSGLTTVRATATPPTIVSTPKPTPKPSTSKSTTKPNKNPGPTKPSSTKPRPSAPTPAAPLPTAKPNPSRTSHHRQRHQKFPEPLLRHGLVERDL
jgi:hypothetical protein